MKFIDDVHVSRWSAMPSLSHFSSNNLCSPSCVLTRNSRMLATGGHLAALEAEKEAEQLEESGPTPLSYHLFSLEIHA